MSEDLEYRVEKDQRCTEYGYPSGTKVRCTRQKNHNGEHVCQLETGTILGRWSSK